MLAAHYRTQLSDISCFIRVLLLLFIVIIIIIIIFIIKSNRPSTVQVLLTAIKFNIRYQVWSFTTSADITDPPNAFKLQLTSYRSDFGDARPKLKFMSDGILEYNIAYSLQVGLTKNIMNN